MDLRAFKELIGDGFFTKELEHALLNGDIDFAVHSSKDLPSAVHHSLPWVAFGQRESTRDLLVISPRIPVEDLESIYDLRIGTSSPRRRAQLEGVFPLAKVLELRGNVPTRAGKVLTGEFDAVVLAEAGLNRLGLIDDLSKKGVQFLELPFVTAPCQGILGLQGSRAQLDLLMKIGNADLTEIARLEKAVLMFLGGGCHLEVGCEVSRSDAGWALNFFWSTEERVITYSEEGSSGGALLRNLFHHIAKCTSIRGELPEIMSEHIAGKKHVWITAPLKSQLRPHEQLIEKGLDPQAWPLIEQQPTWTAENLMEIQKQWPNLKGIVLTSPFGADLFVKEFLATLGGIKALDGKKIYCVGEATQTPFSQIGIKTEPLPKKATAEGLAELLKQSEKNDPVLVVGTRDSRLLRELDGSLVPWSFLELYKSFPAEGPLSERPRGLKSGDAIVFTSGSAVTQFARHVSPGEARKYLLFAFGPSTADKLQSLGFDSIENPRSGSWSELASLIKEHLK